MKLIVNYYTIFKIKLYRKIVRFLTTRTPNIKLIDILEKNFAKNKSEFCVIIVGANDGISHDFLYDFMINKNVVGIAIEPSLDIFNKLKNNFSIFPNIKLINKAVHPDKKEVILYRVDPLKYNQLPDWCNGIGSLFSEYHEKLAIDKKNIIEETVKADSLMNIFSEVEFSNRSIDLLQIDTEGFDFEIIKLIEFKKYHPKIIKYEYIHLTSQEQHDSITLLKHQGYICFSEGNDMLAIDLTKIKL
ncbi:MAG: FkbM family methyltransferase [Bacteroidota bacterium]|nr:FkbM family methyltransferase [Bacteroidota bacterium]